MLIGRRGLLALLALVAMPLRPAQQTQQGAELPPGTLVLWAGEVPKGWLLCDGAALSRASYPALFAAIGAVYGSHDPKRFQLPDLRGRYFRGDDRPIGGYIIKT